MGGWWKVGRWVLRVRMEGWVDRFLSVLVVGLVSLVELVELV